MYSATVHKHTFSSQFCQFLPRHGLQQQILLRTRSFPLMWIQIDFSNLNFLPLSCAECLVDFADSWKLIHFLLSVNEGLHTFSGEQVVFPWEYFSHWERGILVFTSWWSSHQGIWIGRSAWILRTFPAWSPILLPSWLPPLGFKKYICVEKLTLSCFCQIHDRSLASSTRRIRRLTWKAHLNYEEKVCWTQKDLPLWFSQVGAHTTSASPCMLYFDSA